MNIVLAVSILVGIITFSLGILVYNRNKEAVENRLFLGLTIFSFFWMALAALGARSTHDMVILWSGRLGFVASTWIVYFIYRFSYYFPEKNDNYSPPWKIFDAIAIGVSLLSLSPYLFRSVVHVNSHVNNAYEFGYYIFAGYFLVFILASIYNLVSKLRFLDPVARTQAKFILIGIMTSTLLAFLTNFLLPPLIGSLYSEQFGPLTIVVFVVLTTYAISKHHLFAIRVIATEMLVGIVAAVLLVDFLVALFSGDLMGIIFKGVVLSLFSYLGWSLVESVLEEIEKRKLLQEQRRKERDMLDILGHELRTPMSIIKNYFYMVQKMLRPRVKEILDEKELEKYTKYAENIDESIEREIKLINTLLNATHSDKQAVRLEREPVDIIDVVEDAMASQEKEAERKGVYLKFNKPAKDEELPRVWADRVKMQEIMDNLVSNAVKYTNEGGVTITLEQGGSAVTVRVEDTGIGIPSEAIDNLGKKFYRVDQYIGDDESGNLVRPGGTGLGLYVAFNLIKAHGGMVEVKSEVGQGSTFIFTVPIYRDS